MKSIEKLRRFIDDQFVASGQAYLDGMAIAGSIQNEIDANYMRLPVDADGMPIRVGDEVEWFFGNGKYTVCGVGELVALRTHESNCFTVNPRFLHHVNPRTLEDVLNDYAKDVYEHGRDMHDVEKYAAEIRELLGGDAE